MAKTATSAQRVAKAKPTPPQPSGAEKSGRAAVFRPATKAAAAPNNVSPKAAAKPTVTTPMRPNTITMKQLAVGVSEKHGLAKKQADALVVGLFRQLVDHLKAGERVRIGGLGILEVKDRPARMGRNPATGEPVEVKASRKVAFRASKDMKEAI